MKISSSFALLSCLGTFALSVGVATPARAQIPSAFEGLRPQQALESDALSGHSAWKTARDQAFATYIDGSQYECAPTAFSTWIDDQLLEISNFDDFVTIAQIGALDWPTYYSFLQDQDASDEFIGIDGEYTRELVRRHKDAKRFWSMSKQEILLQAMHGEYLADDAKMVPMVEVLYGVDTESAQGLVDYVQWVIESDPGLGFDHPLFTLNAFAITTRGEPEGSPFQGIPDKIVMGDGILQALEELGLDHYAVDAVHAHEFAHHVQYKLGLADEVEGTPEETRRLELMADAFGAYFSAHPRGSAFRADRILPTFQASYLIGDCAFDNPSHHGTPNQRLAAAKWGAWQAQSGFMRGLILPAVMMLSLFDAQLPVILAPDANQG